MVYFVVFRFESFSGLKPHVSLTEGGKDQRDFVVAYTEATRSTASGMSVKLKFDHAFSQVIVQATKGADADKRVKIKGGWIVNAKTNGAALPRGTAGVCMHRC